MANSQNKTKSKEKEKAFKRQGGLCWICNKPMKLKADPNDPLVASADHVIPRSLGGPVKGNIKAAHRKCNIERGNNYQGALIEFMRL
jgi:5-methylcytosine-specific restriction endonuclease McrA